jgi:ABC-2 type transport system ATP-binding protein
MRVKAVECRDVWMVYRNFMERGVTALKGVSLDIENGEIFGILGPNGAGKTTLISVLSTILIPTKGEVRILGIDAFKNTKKVRERVNITSGVRLPWGMKVYECLRFYALCYGITDRNVIEKLIADFELEDYRNTRFDDLSAGNKQKLNLARAFLNNPEVVFLDEPTANLDPDIARKIREMILQIIKEKHTTIILTTHNMREAEMLCDRIAFIRDGKIIAEGTSEELKRFTKANERVIVGFKKPALSSLPTTYPYELDENSAIFYVDDAERFAPKIVLELSKAGIEIEYVKMEEITLEDVFIELSESN